MTLDVNLPERISSRIGSNLPVRDFQKIGSRFIVLLDPDARRKSWGQFPNLLSFDHDGNKLWTAELPTTDTGDTYYKIESGEPLIALSVRSYACEIDAESGRVIKKDFFK